MRTRSVLYLTPLLGVLAVWSVRGLAQRAATPTTAAATAPADATARIVAAAQALTTTLDDAGRSKGSSPSTARRRLGGRTCPAASSSVKACASATSLRRSVPRL